MRGEVVKSVRHSGSLEKLIEAYAEIQFFKLCGIAEPSNVTTMRSRVAARDDVNMNMR